MNRTILAVPVPQRLVLQFSGAAPAVPAQNAHRFTRLVQIRTDVFFRRFAEFLNEIVFRIMHRYPLPIAAAANATAITAITPPYTRCASGLSHAHAASLIARPPGVICAPQKFSSHSVSA